MNNGDFFDMFAFFYAGCPLLLLHENVSEHRFVGFARTCGRTIPRIHACQTPTSHSTYQVSTGLLLIGSAHRFSSDVQRPLVRARNRIAGGARSDGVKWLPKDPSSALGIAVLVVAHLRTAFFSS
jgi:hypothetical protein